MGKGNIVILKDPQLERWGKRIKAFRELAGLSQQELADRMEVNFTTVWRWEEGRTEPRRRLRRILAQELNTDEQSLFS